MKRKSWMRNPRNGSLDHSKFEGRYVETRASEKKMGATASVGRGIEDVPKTSEYAFFRKLRQDVEKTGLPVRKESNRIDECQSGYCSGVGNIVMQSFRNLQSSLHTENIRPLESRNNLSPISGPSKAADMNYMEQHDFRNPEFAHPIKKTVPVNFQISSSPFRNPARSAATNYVYGQGNFFSTKRDKLLQLVVNTYPESKELNLNGVDLVNSMLGRLFPYDYDSKHAHRAPKLRQQDICTSMSNGFPENNADYEEFYWSGSNGSREAGSLVLLDYGCMSPSSTELSKWGGEYGMFPYRSRENEYTHYKMKEPYHSSDYGKSRSAWKKYLLSRLPRETFESHTSSDLDSHHLNGLPSRQNLLLGWTDEKTEDEYQLPIAAYKVDYDISLHSNCQSFWNNDYPPESRLSSFRPQFGTGHYGNIHSYFQPFEETDNYIASHHLLEDRQNKRRDIIHSHNSGSCFTTSVPDIIPKQDIPYMNHHLLVSTPDIFNPKQELVPSNYPRGQLMCIDQPWEVCGKELTHYINHDCHSYTDEEAYQIGYAD